MGAELWDITIALGILAGVALGCWRAYRAGKAVGEVDGFRRGEASERATAQIVAQLAVESEAYRRRATIRANRSEGAKKAWAKRRGEAS